MVKMLQGQRAQVQKELAKLDEAIAVLRELPKRQEADSYHRRPQENREGSEGAVGKAQERASNQSLIFSGYCRWIAPKGKRLKMANDGKKAFDDGGLWRDASEAAPQVSTS
jgi:hypothetical protein